MTKARIINLLYIKVKVKVIKLNRVRVAFVSWGVLTTYKQVFLIFSLTLQEATNHPKCL